MHSVAQHPLVIDQYQHDECEAGQSIGPLPGTGYKPLSTHQPFRGEPQEAPRKFVEANYKSLGTRHTKRYDGIQPELCSLGYTKFGEVTLIRIVT